MSAVCLNEEELQKESDVRLCKDLRLLMGGRKYAKQSELTQELLLKYLADKGDIVPVELFQVKVQKFDGQEFSVTMEARQNQARSQYSKGNTVQALKGAIEENDATSRWQQQLFLTNMATLNANEPAVPLQDCDQVDGSSSVLLYVADNKVFSRSGVGATISDLGLVIQQHSRNSNMCLTNITAHDNCTAFVEFNIANDSGLDGEGEGFVGALVCQPDLDLDKYHAYGQNQGA